MSRRLALRVSTLGAIPVAVILATVSGCPGTYEVVHDKVPDELLAIDPNWRDYTNTDQLFPDVPAGEVKDDLEGIVGCWATATSMVDMAAVESDPSLDMTDEGTVAMLQLMQDKHYLDIWRFNADGTYRWISFSSASFSNGRPIDSATKEAADQFADAIEATSPQFIIVADVIRADTSDGFWLVDGRYTIVDERTVRFEPIHVRYESIVNPPDGAEFFDSAWSEDDNGDEPYNMWLTLDGNGLQGSDPPSDWGPHFRPWTFVRVVCPP